MMESERGGMSEPIIGENGNGQAVDPNEFKTILTIEVNPNGKMQVKGSIVNDQMGFYGLMHTAIRTVEKAWDKAAQSAIVKPHNGFLNGIRGMKR